MPARTRPATVAEINALKKPGRHSVGDSLILYVAASGARSWIARVRDADGRRRDMGLGPYPDVSLADARSKARELRNTGRDGQAILSKAERRRASRTVPTFKEAALAFHEESKLGWKNEKHAEQWLSTMTMHVFDKLGDRSVDAIETADVIDVLSPIWQRIPETARRIRQRVIAVIDWAFARGFRASQISAKAVGLGLGTQRVKAKNFAALPYGEVPALFSKLAERETIGRLCLQFLLLTATRSGEARGAAWSEIDEARALWTIPADRMKLNEEHVIPLSARALTIIQAAKALRVDENPLLFPGERKPIMSDVGLTKVLRTAGVSGAQGTVHGFRSSFRDWVSEETDFPGDVAEAALAHAISNKVEAAYRRGKLLAKRAQMMAAWCNYLEGRDNLVRLEAVA